ncbi:GIY-YIG nuclease family protein [Caenispirillum bisanense]|uniref:T5orf172 domain-containing protein n=1 Tax=Caenispirillum bisanense TaxID=414052 RepID=A0A286H0L0_9PROT|nr:GIY-YIG nuclease family protein [Caenispirillum bisanense]SOE00879.1 T5orf172 domain-containing protein [Caenispirillum bisanense]
MDYVYALINPAMPGLVKVGWTARDPHERADALTASTASPLPFVVIYYEPVSDGRAAEAAVHRLLEISGLRINKSREFFSCDAHVVVRAIVKVCGSFKNKIAEHVSHGEVEGCRGNEFSDFKPKNLLREGLKLISSADDPLSDPEKGRKLVEASAILGYAPGQFHLAKIKIDCIGRDPSTEKSRNEMISSVSLLRSSLSGGYGPAIILLSFVALEYGRTLELESDYIKDIPRFIGPGSKISEMELADIKYGSDKIFYCLRSSFSLDKLERIMTPEILLNPVCGPIWRNNFFRFYATLRDQYIKFIEDSRADPMIDIMGTTRSTYERYITSVLDFARSRNFMG